MIEKYLSHHGIKGQKHGVRNGPPYPLDYSKLSPEEREQHKKEAISTGNIKEADANVKYFNNEDIQNTINRYLKKAELHKMSNADLKTGKKVIEDLIEKGNLFVRFTNMGIAVYNNVAKVTNAVNEGATGKKGKLPIIQSGGGGGDNKKKDKK